MGTCFSWLKHNHYNWVGPYKQQPYPYRSSATNFQSNFHIPVHFAESEPIHCISARFGAVRHQYVQFEAFQSHLGLIETLGFHSEKIRRVFIRFEPFCIDSIRPIQCISEPFATFQHHSNKFMSIQIDTGLIGIMGFHTQKI